VTNIKFLFEFLLKFFSNFEETKNLLQKEFEIQPSFEEEIMLISKKRDSFFKFLHCSTVAKEIVDCISYFCGKHGKQNEKEF
jgi:hypothetical protein